jgi:hypothetical protein
MSLPSGLVEGLAYSLVAGGFIAANIPIPNVPNKLLKLVARSQELVIRPAVNQADLTIALRYPAASASASLQKISSGLV